VLVHEVMTKSPVSVRPDTSTKAALQLLDRHGITMMPVVDGDGDVLGVVSEGDLVHDSLPPDARAHLMPQADRRATHPMRVEEVMTRKPLWVHRETDLGEAAELMISRAVKSLPVVDGSHLVGMVSRRDVVHALARDDEPIRDQLADLFRSLEQDWTVEVRAGDVFVDGPVGAKESAMAEAVAATVPGVITVTVREGGGR
jgi:CBS domain-containing protein